MSRKKWILSEYNKDAAASIAEACNLDPFAALLLVSRNIDSDAAQDFLATDTPLCDPFLLPDMQKAVDRIHAAIDSFERIAIFGDYDCDGVTSTAILYQYLEACGADVICYIPERLTEGYGMSIAAVQKLADQDVKLIVTVDNGIVATEEVDYAKKLGMDVVVTDHHKQGGELPKAVAVVDAQREDCNLPFHEWAGVGVAFKLICALEGEEPENLFPDFADLVAIGTLADVVILTDENRRLVQEGLRYLNTSNRPGIVALREIAGATNKKLNATSVSFTLAPRINAAGRMGSATTALKLLLSEDLEDAKMLAEQIDAYNKERQTIENEISKQAFAQIESNPKLKFADVLVVAGENWHPGVIGIVAARLTTHYGKPSVVITTEGDTGKGSCRSLEGFSIYDALSASRDNLLYFGGHTLAAGLGIETEKIDAFRDAVNAYAKTQSMPFLTLHLDCKLNPAYINTELLDSLSALEPYGAGNPEPCFGLYNMQLTGIRALSEGKHLRLNLKKGNSEIQAMLFSVRQAEFPYHIGDTIDVAVKITPNEFRGEIRPSVQIQDIRFSNTDVDNYLKSLRLYEKYRYGTDLNEKELAFITPNRDFLLAVYKFLKQQDTWKFDVDAFCKRSGCPFSSAATALVALDVLCELNLVERTENGDIQFIHTEKTQKVDLESSVILQNLKSKKGD